jgi:hypothetical protein
VIGTRAGDDKIPDDSGICAILVLGIGPVCCYVYKYLLRVPGEKGREVCFEREFDDSVFFLLGAIVVGSALDSVGINGLEIGALKEKKEAYASEWAWISYTCVCSGLMTPEGARGEMKSDRATNAAKAKATVVKNPKVFCNR